MRCIYDAQHRRIRKRVLKEDNGTLVEKSDLRFLYDGWNMVAEIEFAPSAVLPSPRLVRSYAWGTDLSGSEQGAGGVGGLLMVEHAAQPGRTAAAVWLPCYDGNGNVSAYLDAATGALEEHHDYDPFGNEVVGDFDDTLAGRSCPFRFSTKYTDDETGLLYYGYRYYSPETGRWTGRDPIGENGGMNLYGMVGNAATVQWDDFGLAPGRPGHGTMISPQASASLIETHQRSADTAFDLSLGTGLHVRRRSLARNVHRLKYIGFTKIGTDAGNLFVYTCKYGWIDHGHYFKNAWGAYRFSVGTSILSSLLVEVGQTAVLSDSMWAIEDLMSNARGREFGEVASRDDGWILDYGVAPGSTPLSNFLNQRPFPKDQFANISVGWRNFLVDAGAVRWPKGKAYVKDILEKDVEKYGGGMFSRPWIFTQGQAKTYKEHSEAWKCLCNGDKPISMELKY